MASVIMESPFSVRSRICFDSASAIRFVGETEPPGVRWQQARKFLGPFDDTHAVAVEVFVEPDLERVVLILQSVEIEMIQRQSSAGIFVDEGEGRTRHGGLGAEAGGEALGKMRFAC